ncbi:MAG: bifunctional diguanylate cyclase/phosphodiesterase [Patulibacter minatonensis]
MFRSGPRTAAVAVVASGASIALFGVVVTGFLWAGVMAAANLRRMSHWSQDPQMTGRRRLLEIGFALATLCWLASDAWRVLGYGAHTARVAPGPEVLAHIGTLFLIATIIGVVRSRSGARIETWLDSLSFMVALAAPIYVAFVAPAAGDPTLLPWIVGWAAMLLAAMFFGGLYVMSGGIWNLPAVLLALAVVANSAVGVGAHLADPATVVDLPRFLPGYVLAAFVAAHPRLTEVYLPGGRPSGIPLSVRVWMLIGAVALPLGTLAWCYVQAEPVPIAAVVGPLAVMAGVVGVRAWLLVRAGIRDWSVPLTISVAALLVSTMAVALALRSESAREGQRATAALSQRLPEAKQLGGVLLRAAGLEPGTPERSTARWAEIIGNLNRDPRVPRDALHRYVAAAAPIMRVAANGGARPTRAQLARAASADAALVEALTRALADQRAAAERGARSVRLFTVGALTATLLALAILLLRFNRERARMELQHQKTHDLLTGLPNRLALEHQLKDTHAPAAGELRPTLALIDLDDFKAINDAFGLETGDTLLAIVATRLAERTRNDHFLARTDGDAFAILIPAGQDPLAVAHRALAAISAPIVTGAHSHTIRASVGLAEVGDGRQSSAIRDAELAMYEAKRSPGNSVQVFAADMHERVRDRLQLATELRDAIEAGELHLVYQPIVELSSGRIAGYEALVRWNHPTRGPLSPAQFIPLAEQNGLIVDLGGWVLRTATAQFAEWQSRWTDQRYVSVNIAAAQLSTHVLEQQVRSALEASGLAPELLLLEVTESSLIDDLDGSIAQMDQVRELGTRFALDDFGTGYSSLSYLRRFPVDVLKVDKSFIDALGEVDGSALVRAIIDMAIVLRLRVVAEGIEEGHQAMLLRQFDCDLGQGFHFSRPVTAEDVGDQPGRFAIPSQALRITG